MRKWVYLFIAMVMLVNLAIMGIGCSKKETPPPEPKTEKPAETPAPAAPAGTVPSPAPAAPGATQK